MAVSVEAGPKRGGPKPEINVTPLVDVVLVLLIIFMLVTPMLQKGQAVELPFATHVAKKTNPDHVLVAITKDRHYYVDKDLVDERELEAEIKKAFMAKPSVPVLIKADRSITCGPVRKVVAIMGKLGLTGVALAAQTPNEQSAGD